jgi:hypothetical protein
MITTKGENPTMNIPSGGALRAVCAAMLVAGPVMIIRSLGGRREIRAELAAQQITFPDGRQVETGPQARAYSNLIRTHLAEATGGRTYAQLNAEVISAKNNGEQSDTLTALKQTAFTGETLRASLMSAYQAWQLAALAGGLGALVTGLGAALLTNTPRRGTPDEAHIGRRARSHQ